MREDMNPLDLLAEVAVSCSDDEKCDKVQHCDEIMEAEAEFVKSTIAKSVSSGKTSTPGTNDNNLIPASAETNNNNEAISNTSVITVSESTENKCCSINTPGIAESNNIISAQVLQESELAVKEDITDQVNVQDNSLCTGNSIKKTQSISTDTENAGLDKCIAVQNHVSDKNTTVNCDYKPVGIKLTGVVISGTGTDQHSPHSNLEHSTPEAPQSVLGALCNSPTVSQDSSVQRVHPTKKCPTSLSGTATTVKSANSAPQRVTRLLSPNFKLTMTDTIPVSLHNRKVSSLLIGNMGSAAIRNALNQTQTVSRLVPVKQRSSLRKYPNITMSGVPHDFPLLDHDYCYQNFCDIVKAAKQEADKKAAASQPADVAVSEDGKPPKRKYRTKRIIAEELECKRRAELREKAAEGDEQAQAELGEIEKQEEEARQASLAKEVKSKRKPTKRKSDSTAAVAVDSDEEAMNEITEDVDDVNPVIDHNPAFKDQFLYFGSKKYQSRRRHLNKKEDPYASFWKTGALKPGQAGAANQTRVSSAVPGTLSELSMDSGLSYDMMLNTNQEINDVFDVLGISPCESQASEYDCFSDTPTSHTHTDSPADTCKGSDINISGGECVTESYSFKGTIKSGVPSQTSSSDEPLIDNTLPADQGLPFTEEVVACGREAHNDGFDDLLQGMTMDQVSELILSLDVEPSLSNVCIEPTEAKQANAVASRSSKHVQSLVMLTTAVCRANDIQLPEVRSDPVDNQNFSQQSHTSAISLDFTEADLLASDKNINLDLLNELNATPPKSSRPISLFETPTSMTMSPSLLVDSPQLSTSLSSDSLAGEICEVPVQSPVVVPVTMYWNTFPALLVDGVKYVRLIDISRQALPSKETGLLKKRAQTLGYEVGNCTDLQRNLLVRYAFACPSRSNLMVSEAGAAEVIASYMEKSEMEELSRAPDLPSQQLAANVTSTTTMTVRAPSEPITLMPQVLIEHKPLQQSGSVGGKNSTRPEPVAPERSSRLRQLKSSYRRFLSLGSSAAATTSNVKAESGNTEENASDRGYHSDQSPDSVIEKIPTHSQKSNNRKINSTNIGKKHKSTRRSLSSTSQAVKKATTLQCDTDALLSLNHAVKSAELSKALMPSPQAELLVSTTPTPLSPALSTAASSTSDFSPSIHSLDGRRRDDSQSENTVSEPSLNVSTKSEIVQIRHRDLVPKRNGNQSSQDGDLYLPFFKSLHSPCIECCVCQQFYTLKAFTKHQHLNRKLVPVKVRQRLEARGASLDSDSWQTFKRQKRLYETARSPLKKLSETRLSEPLPTLTQEQLIKAPSDKNIPRELGKRIPKQKKCNPDEVYYTNPCITNTTRKRRAELELDIDKKRKCTNNALNNLKKRVER